MDKGGHPQFKSTPPQLPHIPETKSIAELRTKKRCGAAIAELQLRTLKI
jgi:hypothetical protein